MSIKPYYCDNPLDPCCKDIQERVDYSYVGNSSLRRCILDLVQNLDKDEIQNWLDEYRVKYEPRRVGKWSVQSFEISDLDCIAYNYGEIDAGRWMLPGNYTKLVLHEPKGDWIEQIVMSDSLMEIGDHIEFIDRAYGRVLINGLGLGMVAHALLSPHKRECIEHIDIVEFNQEVIDLIAHYFEGDPKVTIHHGDAYTFEWPENKTWHCAWHDIWYEIDDDDYVLQNKLHDKYRDRVIYQDSWKRSWYEGFLKWQEERDLNLSKKAMNVAYVQEGNND